MMKRIGVVIIHERIETCLEHVSKCHGEVRGFLVMSDFIASHGLDPVQSVHDVIACHAHEIKLIENMKKGHDCEVVTREC